MPAGIWCVGIRTGYEDQEARARIERKPAFLADAAGVWYEEFSTVDAPITVTGSPDFELPADSRATRWIDGLNPDGAETLISYEHPHFGRWPAMTTRVHGRGRVSYVGTVPNLTLAIAISRWLAKDSDSTWRRQSDQQTVTGGTAVDGTRLRIIHNWSFTPSSFVVPAAVRDLLVRQHLRRRRAHQSGCLGCPGARRIVMVSSAAWGPARCWRRVRADRG